MPLAKTLRGFAFFMAASSLTQAVCPSSVVVGSPDSPVEIASSLKDDPTFAKMHLDNVSRLLPRVRESCQSGIENSCRLANFLTTAKASLECYAGVGGSTVGQMRSGDARDTNKLSSTGSAPNEICRCGPDYVQCQARLAQRSGSRYSISSDGRTITLYDAKGLIGSVKGLDEDGRCSAIAK